MIISLRKLVEDNNTMKMGITKGIRRDLKMVPFFPTMEQNCPVI